MGPRFSLDVVVKSPRSFRETNPGRLACSLVIILTELPRLYSLNNCNGKYCFFIKVVVFRAAMVVPNNNRNNMSLPLKSKGI